MSNAYMFAMPGGTPGTPNRVGGRGPDIEAQIMDPDNPVSLYGLFGQIDATTGFFRAMAAADATAYGMLVRPFPTQALSAAGFSGSVPLGSGNVPPQFQTAIDVMKAGYLMTTLYGATAAKKNGLVYVRVDGEDADHPLGGVEAADDGANAILIAGAYFTGESDGNGNVEVALNP